MIIRSITSCRVWNNIGPENDSFRSSSSPKVAAFNIEKTVDRMGSSFRPLRYFQSSLVFCESTTVNDSNPLNNPSENAKSLLDLVRSGKTSDVKRAIVDANLRETDEDFWTCLHWAVEMGHRDLVEIFLDADPLLLNMKTREGLSCINIAAWRGDDKMVQLLLQQGAEIDDKTKWGETPLHHAVTFGHAKVCAILLKAGADAHSEDRLKRTPYQIAMQKGTKQVREILSQYAPANK